MQTSLFPDSDKDLVGAATPEPAVVELAASLPPNLRLGTSSWHYPGWTGLVWDRDYSPETLSRHGLSAYAQLFQISPLPLSWLKRLPELMGRLHDMLQPLRDLRERAPHLIVAVEVRDPQWLTPQLTSTLSESCATYCLGLHAKMPPIAEQLPILRALWPGPLVCRWNLHPRHGAFGYENAKNLYAPYDRLVDPDLETRAALAKVIAGTVGAGQPAYITIGNKAEGSSPLSVIALAQAVHGLRTDVQVP